MAVFHKAESGLIFNSGYSANIGLFSCIADKGDTIIYDQYIHASARDGIRLSNARSFSFEHNIKLQSNFSKADDIEGIFPNPVLIIPIIKLRIIIFHSNILFCNSIVI